MGFSGGTGPQALEHWVAAGSFVAAGSWVGCLAWARYPRWWDWINTEGSPMTWAQSVVIWSTGLLCLLVAWARWDRQRGAGASVWAVVGSGFLFLALDERFHLHESLRDRVLAPRGIAIPGVPWVAPGDFLLLGYAVAGALLLPAFLRAMGDRPTSRRWFWVGAVVAGAAVVLDAIDPQGNDGQIRIRSQFVEELLEFGAQICFFNGALWMLARSLHDSPGVSPSAGRHPDERDPR